jgi:predicted nucleic acid-binding protein
VDTGPLVALFNAGDEHHDWMLAVLAGLELPLWTCEAVVTEAANLTGKGRELLEMIAGRKLRIGLSVDAQAEAIGSLLGRYGPRMDLADACIVRMSELTRDCRVLTVDRRDFSFYRRNGRQVIPLLAP